ncbi:MAG: hypothetical protein JSR99_03470 [Proteobacteria bacterium]|nr:hypothetical protein [Pseudomonadota bacterium]
MNPAVLLAFAVGAWSLLGQFIFNRIIFFYVANSEYTAASIITLHLAGFWLGATLARKYNPEIWPLLLVSALITMLAEVLVWRMGIVWFSLPMIIGMTAVCGIALATASGGIITRLMGKGSGAGQTDHAQHVFMADTAGSVLGALMGGFWLIPHLGIEMAFHALLLAQVMALAAWRRGPFGVAVGIAGVAMVLALQATVPALAERHQVIAVEGMPIASKGVSDTLVYSKRSPYGLISVTGKPDFLTLNIDSRGLCGVRKGKFTEASEWQMGALPVKMIDTTHSKPPLRAANIGLGCGMTAAALLDGLSDASHLDVVELNPEMTAAQRTFWPLLPKNPGDPRARIHIADGFGYFAQRKANEPKYDIIALDVAWMQNMNATHLFSEEMYRNLRRNMADDGVLSVWIEESSPFSKVSLISFRTLKAVFANVFVSRVGGVVVFYASPTRGDLANYLTEVDAQLTDWVSEASADAPVNRLGDLAMNRAKFTTSGDSTWEKLQSKYSEMRRVLAK